MNYLTEFNISGMWVAGGVSEDCTLAVGWRYEDDLPRVLKVEDCRGALSGTNYIDHLDVSPQLMDHIRDMILEIYEV